MDIFKEKKRQESASEFEFLIQETTAKMQNIENNELHKLKGFIESAKTDSDTYTADDVKEMVKRYQALITSIKSKTKTFSEFTETGNKI